MRFDTSDPRFVIFDFDGTLADSFSTVEKVASELFGDRYTPMSRDEFRELGARGVFKHYGVPMWKVPYLVWRVLRRLRHEQDIPLFPGIEEMFDVVSKQYMLGIISSNSQKNIRAILERQRIYTEFSFIDGGVSLFGKHRAIVSALKRHAIDPSRAVYVGDEDRDIVAAKRAGVPVVAVSWGYNSEERLQVEAPDVLIDSPGELLAAIEEIA